VGEIEDAHYAVDQRQAERDHGVEAAQQHSADQNLDKCFQGRSMGWKSQAVAELLRGRLQ